MSWTIKSLTSQSKFINLCFISKKLIHSDNNGIRTLKNLVRKWTVLLNGWVFVYELSDGRFESCCWHLNFWYCAFSYEIITKLRSKYSSCNRPQFTESWLIHDNSLHKIWRFSLRISLVNLTKSAVSCNLVTFTEEIRDGKLHFCAVYVSEVRILNC